MIDFKQNRRSIVAVAWVLSIIALGIGQASSSRRTPAGALTIWPWGHSRSRSVRAFESISTKGQMRCCLFWKALELAFWAIHARPLRRVHQFISPKAFGMEFRTLPVSCCCCGWWHRPVWKHFFVRWAVLPERHPSGSLLNKWAKLPENTGCSSDNFRLPH